MNFIYRSQKVTQEHYVGLITCIQAPEVVIAIRSQLNNKITLALEYSVKMGDTICTCLHVLDQTLTSD